MNTILTWLGVQVPVFAFLGRVPGWVIRSVLGVVTVNLAYPIFSLLLKNRWVNWFFTHTTPTHYYARYHEPETSPRDLE